MIFNIIMDQISGFFNDVGDKLSPVSRALAPISNTFISQFENMGKMSSGITQAITGLFSGLSKNLVSFTDPTTLLMYCGIGLVGVYLVTNLMNSSRSAPYQMAASSIPAGMTPYDRYMRR